MTDKRFEEIECKSIPTDMDSAQDCIAAESFVKSLFESEWNEFTRRQEAEQDCSPFDRMY